MKYAIIGSGGGGGGGRGGGLLGRLRRGAARLGCRILGRR